MGALPKPKPNDLVMGGDDVAAHVRIQKSQPSLKSLRERFPNARYKEWKDARGVTQWKLRVNLNEQGARQDVIDAVTPAARLEATRAGELSAKTPRVEVVDRWGVRKTLDARFADGIAASRGMHHVIKAKGAVIERGMDGMLFRLRGEAWEATGRWCLTTPWRQDDKPAHGEADGSMGIDGIQRDPDGTPWMFIEGAWRAV